MRILLPGSESKRVRSAARSGELNASSRAKVPRVRVSCVFVFICLSWFKMAGSTVGYLTQFIPLRFENNALSSHDRFMGFHRRDGRAEPFRVTGRGRAMDFRK